MAKMEKHFQFNLMKCTLHTQIYQIRYGINIVKCMFNAMQYAIEAFLSVTLPSTRSPIPYTFHR